MSAEQSISASRQLSPRLSHGMSGGVNQAPMPRETTRLDHIDKRLSDVGDTHNSAFNRLFLIKERLLGGELKAVGEPSTSPTLPPGSLNRIDTRITDIGNCNTAMHTLLDEIEKLI